MGLSGCLCVWSAPPPQQMGLPMSKSIEAGPQLLWPTHPPNARPGSLSKAKGESCCCDKQSPGLLDSWSGSLASVDRSRLSRQTFYVCASQTLLTRVCPVEAKTGRKKGGITQKTLGGSSAELHLKKSLGSRVLGTRFSLPVSIPCLPLLPLLLISPLLFLRSIRKT